MRALLCGTRGSSLARVLGRALKLKGWEVHLFSRQAKEGRSDGMSIHRADITDIDAMDVLLEKVCPSLVIISADPGFAFGGIADIGLVEVRRFIDAKMFGSVNVVSLLARKKISSKVIFLCGAKEKKIDGAFLYELVNITIAQFVDQINQEYEAHGISAYYLETPAIKGSGLVTQYEEQNGRKISGYPAEAILSSFAQITEGEVSPGFVAFSGITL